MGAVWFGSRKSGEEGRGGLRHVIAMVERANLSLDSGSWIQENWDRICHESVRGFDGMMLTAVLTVVPFWRYFGI